MGGCITRPQKGGLTECSYPRSSDYDGGQATDGRKSLDGKDSTVSGNYSSVEEVCIICCTYPKDLAFGCGHQICGKCSQEFYSCPVCRHRIHIRVKLIRESEQIWCSLCPTDQFNPKDMAFDCGHQTCSKCGKSLQCCPICRRTIKAKIKLY